MIKIVPTAAVFAGTVESCWELVCWQCMTGDDPPPQNELSPLLGQEAWDWRRAAPWEATRQAAGRAAGHGHRWGGGWPSGRQKTAAAGGGGHGEGQSGHEHCTTTLPRLCQASVVSIGCPVPWGACPYQAPPGRLWTLVPTNKANFAAKWSFSGRVPSSPGDVLEDYM